jgi:hypothetical protein
MARVQAGTVVCPPGRLRPRPGGPSLGGVFGTGASRLPGLLGPLYGRPAGPQRRPPVTVPPHCVGDGRRVPDGVAVGLLPRHPSPCHWAEEWDAAGEAHHLAGPGGQNAQQDREVPPRISMWGDVIVNSFLSYLYNFCT